jgi:thioesterase domain-containing protein
MLQTIQRSGAQPPLIIVHGLYGVMPLGHGLSRVLGPDQPLSVVTAWGFDGIAQPLETISEMAVDYVRQIRQAWPRGPYLIGGICSGGLLALDVARALLAAGETVGRVLLIDPPAMPFSYNEQLSQLDPTTQSGMTRRLQEQVLAEFREYATRYEQLPFNARDPVALQAAAKVGVACMLAFFKHRPQPFAAPVELIVSDHRAAGYFGPALPWQSILTGPRWVHILPGVHGDMFRTHSDAVFRLVSFYLETALAETEVADRDPESVARSA